MPKSKKENTAKKETNNSKKTAKSSGGVSNYSYALLVIGVSLIFFSFIVGSILSKPKAPEPAQIEQEVEEVIQEPVEPDIQTLPVDQTFTSKSYILYDSKNNQILGGKDIDTKVANASTTKVMTALLALEKFPLNKQLVVPESCVGLDGNNVGFLAGETYYLQDLLYGVLLRSGSDAVCTITENYDGDFILEMNNKAKELGLENTQFQNAIGFDNENHYSTSRDLLTLILEAKKIETLKIMMGSRDYTISDVKRFKNYYVQNTNQLLFEIPGTVGYKTGTTSQAGECLIFGYNNFGTELIIVVMGSEDRFSDAKQLLNLYLDKINPNESIRPTNNSTSLPSPAPTQSNSLPTTNPSPAVVPENTPVLSPTNVIVP